MASIGFDNRAFFAGGLDPHNRLLATIEIFDSDTSTWSIVNLSYARESMTAVHVAQYLIFGTGYPGLRGVDIPLTPNPPYRCPNNFSLRLRSI
jgi:hypothetical protein